MLAVAVIFAVPTAAQAAINADWPAYIYSAGHSSYNPNATAITPANVAGVANYWQWKPDKPDMVGQPPGRGLVATPIVVGGRVYIGANNGYFYALDLATKTLVWKRFFGFVTNKTCAARGFSSTATVVPDPSRNNQLTVYVASADGYMYALRASDGVTVWRGVVAIPSTTENDYFNWGSPAVANGKVYMGITSQCDKPLVRGGVIGFNQASGATIGKYYAVPDGKRGGGVWSSVAVGPNGDVYATTGTGRSGDAEAIVRLDGNTLARLEAWQVPTSEITNDSDFGASPTMFTATLNGVQTSMVGACNKNGVFYAMRATNVSAGPVWRFLTAKPSALGQSSCISAGIWDGSRLFVAASPTTINGVTYNGSVRQLDPATGKPVWQTPLNQVVIGTPTLNGSGVIAVGTYMGGSVNGVYLVRATDGQILRKIETLSNKVFAQPVFADNYLLIATLGGGGLYVYRS
jgi:polyvinyl alcohol dehydrogenase (cytochrome)